MRASQKVAEIGRGVGGRGEGLVEAVDEQQDLTGGRDGESSLDFFLKLLLCTLVPLQDGSIALQSAGGRAHDCVGLIGIAAQFPYLAELELDVDGTWVVQTLAP